MDDWRLQGQERFLKGVELRWQKYQPYRKGWEHDHCEFCGKKLSMKEEDATEGYATGDGYHWVCRECFEDFRDTFEWTVLDVRGDSE